MSRTPTGPPGTQPTSPEGLMPDAAHFVSRAWLVDEVATWLEHGHQRVFLLTGDAGTGKSVFSAWVAERRGPPETTPALAQVRAAWSACFFCSERYVGSSTDPRAFVRGIAEQLRRTLPGFDEALAELHRPIIQGTVSATSVSGSAIGVNVNRLVLGGTTVQEAYGQVLETPLRTVLAGERAGAVVLLIDGLDEGLGEAAPTISELVGSLARISGSVRLFLTSQNDRVVTAELLALGEASVRHIDLSSPACAGQVKSEIDVYVRAFAGANEPPIATLRRVRDAAMGNFLYARGFAQDLTAPEPALPGPRPLPADLASRYDDQLERLLEQHYGATWRATWEEALAEVFGLLAVVHGSVPLETLSAWTRRGTPELHMLADRFQQLIREHDGRLALYHPAFAAFLLSQHLDAGHPNRFQVDARVANQRIVGQYTLPLERLAERNWASVDDYGLLQLPTHLDELCATATAASEESSTIERVVELVLDARFREELTARLTDPIAMGRPYRRLAALLLRIDRRDLLETLITNVAGAEQPAIRATAAEALASYAGTHPEPAGQLISRLALSGEGTRRLVALRATSTLSPAAQADVFAEIVERGGQADRLAAAYAIYLNWNTDPARLTRDVLWNLADRITITRPSALKGTLEFLASATITTYINNCSDRKVAELTSDLWRHVLVDRLKINLFNRPLLEKTLIAPAMAHHLSTRVLDAAVGFDRAPARSLLPLQAANARAVESVVGALDPEADLAPIEDHLAHLLGSEVVLFRILAAQVLAVHATTNPSTAMPVMDRLFATGTPTCRTSVVLSLTVLMSDSPAVWLPALERWTGDLLADEPTPFGSAGDALLTGLDILFVPLALAHCRAASRLTLHEQTMVSDAVHLAARQSSIKGTAVAGLYHPALALATFEPAVEADEGFLQAHAVDALGLIANLHPATIDQWLERWDATSLRESVHAASQLDAAHHYIEAIGLYSNGVHQAIHYPIMRAKLLMTVFRLMLDSSSRQRWARAYSRVVLSALRDADYTLINWTR